MITTNIRETAFEEHQLGLRAEYPVVEDADYLSRQLITYIGNKRALLGQIGTFIEQVKHRLDRRRLRVLDAFSGSGVVSRYLKSHSSFLVSNDFEGYAALIGRCYLSNRNEVDFTTLSEIVDDLNRRVLVESLPKGFIEDLYAPKDETSITKDDRVFYTIGNARRLDNYRRMIEDYPSDYHHLLMGPLLNKASVHSNTAGVFKGFYKNRVTGVGQYGGTGLDALSRIRGEITLEMPVLSNFECEYRVLQCDANEAAQQVKGIDLAYIDPPYNQHPYGSNYFMLNLIAEYNRPSKISRVSGIPNNWRRSGYNVKSKSLSLLRELLHRIDAPFLLVSFNKEGFISPDAMYTMLRKLGSVDVLETSYNTFRGSRNLRNRSIHVTEQLFLVERK